MVALVHNSPENLPEKNKISQCGETWRGEGIATIIPDPLWGAGTMQWEGHILPGWERGWTKFQSSTYFNCQETDLLRLSL